MKQIASAEMGRVCVTHHTHTRTQGGSGLVVVYNYRDSMDGSQAGSSVHGISQARILE